MSLSGCSIFMFCFGGPFFLFVVHTVLLSHVSFPFVAYTVSPRASSARIIVLWDSYALGVWMFLWNIVPYLIFCWAPKMSVLN